MFQGSESEYCLHPRLHDSILIRLFPCVCVCVFLRIDCLHLKSPWTGKTSASEDSVKPNKLGFISGTETVEHCYWSSFTRFSKPHRERERERASRFLMRSSGFLIVAYSQAHKSSLSYISDRRRPSARTPFLPFSQLRSSSLLWTTVTWVRRHLIFPFLRFYSSWCDLIFIIQLNAAMLCECVFKCLFLSLIFLYITLSLTDATLTPVFFTPRSFTTGTK